jgi:hypothetical protein
MVDSSGNGNRGTLHNVARVSPGFNGTGKAYRFNGSSSYVSVHNSTSLNPRRARLTISFHMKTSSLPTKGDYDVLRKGAYPGQEYKIELLKSGHLSCVFRGSNKHLNATGGSGFANGAWHHVECVKTHLKVKLVVDGKVVKSTSGRVGKITNSRPLYIGAHPKFDFYKGRLDQVSVRFG